MANKFQIKRTSVSGRTPNTTNAANGSYIDAGELAINLADKKVFTSNGSAYFEVGSNVTSIAVTGTATINTISANGTVGTAGQLLTSNGSTIYWSTVTGGSGAIDVSSSPPGSPSEGDRWIDADNGIEYTYVDDGNSSAWVELGPSNYLTVQTNIASLDLDCGDADGVANPTINIDGGDVNG